MRALKPRRAVVGLMVIAAIVLLQIESEEDPRAPVYIRAEREKP